MEGVARLSVREQASSGRGGHGRNGSGALHSFTAVVRQASARQVRVKALVVFTRF